MLGGAFAMVGRIHGFIMFFGGEVVIYPCPGVGNTGHGGGCGSRSPLLRSIIRFKLPSLDRPSLDRFVSPPMSATPSLLPPRIHSMPALETRLYPTNTPILTRRYLRFCVRSLFLTAAMKVKGGIDDGGAFGSLCDASWKGTVCTCNLTNGHKGPPGHAQMATTRIAS
jgi:hypothetical protein